MSLKQFNKGKQGKIMYKIGGNCFVKQSLEHKKINKNTAILQITSYQPRPFYIKNK